MNFIIYSSCGQSENSLSCALFSCTYQKIRRMLYIKTRYAKSNKMSIKGK